MRYVEGFNFVCSFCRIAIGSFSGSNAGKLYEILGESNHLCESENYLNLGLWNENTKTLDQASENLMNLLAREAGFSSGKTLLDVGCGFGGQDFFWMRNYQLGSITAINISTSQLAKAKKRASELNISNIDFVFEDACKLSFPDNTFDYVAGLESAFHFKTREDFFREAFRVLKPGGFIVLADITGQKASSSLLARLKKKLMTLMTQAFWQIPSLNLYPLEEYVLRMERAGFKIQKSYSILSQVHSPFKAFAAKRIENEEIKARLNPIFYSLLKTSLKVQTKVKTPPMDYIFVLAQKP